MPASFPDPRSTGLSLSHIPSLTAAPAHRLRVWWPGAQTRPTGLRSEGLGSLVEAPGGRSDHPSSCPLPLACCPFPPLEPVASSPLFLTLAMSPCPEEHLELHPGAPGDCPSQDTHLVTPAGGARSGDPSTGCRVGAWTSVGAALLAPTDRVLAWPPRTPSAGVCQPATHECCPLTSAGGRACLGASAPAQLPSEPPRACSGAPGALASLPSLLSSGLAHPTPDGPPSQHRAQSNDGDLSLMSNRLFKFLVSYG